MFGFDWSGFVQAVPERPHRIEHGDAGRDERPFLGSPVRTMPPPIFRSRTFRWVSSVVVDTSRHRV